MDTYTDSKKRVGILPTPRDKKEGRNMIFYILWNVCAAVGIISLFFQAGRPYIAITSMILMLILFLIWVICEDMKGK
jgi:hypothetical protein